MSRAVPRWLLWSTLAGALALTGCAAWRVGQSIDLARRSEPLQRTPPDATLRLLIVGDSTAVGTGASDAMHSLAGLLAERHPRLAIENRARDGARFADLPGQLAGAGRHDIVLIQAGGNDVIRLRGLDALRTDIERATAAARGHADTVVLMPAGNVGNAPFFFPPLSWWMSARARSLHTLVREAALRHGAVYVNLFKERADDPFVQQPALNARDGLHPSDAGYRVWLDELVRQAAWDSRMAPAR